ncbi:hypothetical protein LCGC14_1074190 [marine sediment metagenome]|uniref:Uncharacterized protein n=1 Tax=marine sediment metagenome TaxID=412755 RepID=A0A0F9MH48_9ZZZZ
MALSASILRKIRHEIGLSFQTGTDDDAQLELVFNDVDEGNSSVLVTALIVWRERLANLTTRSFDVTTEGSLLSRSQMIRMAERRIKELELVADETAKGINAVVVGPGSQDNVIGTEF